MQSVRQAANRGIVEVIDRSRFNSVAHEWNSLVEETHDEPFFRHEYLRSWIDNFAGGSNLRVFTARDNNGKLTAALPLIAERGFMYGVPVRRLVSPTNVHSFRFDLVARDAEDAAASFLGSLASDSSWDVVRITDVPEGGNAWHLYEAAVHAGFPTGSWESQRSPYFHLPVSDLSAKFKANLRRRRKRLEEQGDIRVERVTGGCDCPGVIEEIFAMESAGWKGSKGTAAGQTRSTRGFYLDLARPGAAGDYLSLYVLKLNGMSIAAQYGLTRNGVYSLLITSYDESFKRHSPGHLLVEEVVRDCSTRGVREFDFLGCDLEWKLEWTRLVRFHHWLFIFRDSRIGRTLQQAKFRWIPAARQRLGHWSA